MCHQTLGLVQAEIDKSGITSVSISLLPQISKEIGLKSVLHVDHPLGFPLGEANNVPQQTKILKKMLEISQISPDKRSDIVIFNE